MGNIQKIRKIFHAAIYVRLSKEDGDVADAGKKESNSISNQKSLIRDFLRDKEDIEIVSERVDDGYSGSNFERPQFKLMMEDIKRGIVDCVVVKDLSRFGREYIDSGKYIERLFPALGVRFIAVNEIFRMKLGGMSQTAIADYLNDHDVLSPMEYKHSLGIRIQDNFKTHEQAEWSAMSVRRILENEVYKGTLVQGKHTTPNHKVKKLVDKPEEEWVRIEKNHTPIIGERDFALVQKLLGMDTRTSPYETEVYVLSGIAVCGDCGAPMIKRDVPAGGKVYSYYICSRNNATKECSTHRIPREKLESLVLGVLQAHIQNILDMKRILAYVDTVPFQELDIQELENRREAKEQEIQRCKEMRNLLYEDLKEGVVSKEDYAELYEGYNAKRRKAEEAVRAIQREIRDILESKTEKYQWLDYFTEHQNIDRLTRTAVVELVDRVKVFDKKHIEVVFQFDDCYQSMMKQIETTGCAVSVETAGRKEVV